CGIYLYAFKFLGKQVHKNMVFAESAIHKNAFSSLGENIFRGSYLSIDQIDHKGVVCFDIIRKIIQIDFLKIQQISRKFSVFQQLIYNPQVNLHILKGRSCYIKMHCYSLCLQLMLITSK